MPLITFSNNEIKEKIAEICEYADSVAHSNMAINNTGTLLALFDDIKKLAGCIVSKRSILESTITLIVNQEHMRGIADTHVVKYTDTPDEVAVRIDKSRETVYRLCRQGDLDSEQLSPNGSIMIATASVDRYINNKARS